MATLRLRTAPLVLAVTVAGLALSGCSSTQLDGPASDGEATTTPSPSTSSSGEPAGGVSGDRAFCDGIEERDVSLATFGAPPAFYPKEDLTAYSDEVLGAMDGLEPPQAIAEDWAAYLDYQERLRAAADALEPGAIISDSGLIAEVAEQTPRYEAINDWIAANC